MISASSKMESYARVWQVDIMALLFGIGAWISVNGMWVQLPLLVQTLPEGWNLPSYMSVIIQVANIGPILYSILRVTVPSRIKDSYCIYMVMAIGTVSAILMVFFWRQTTYVDGAERSSALLVLLFFLALVDCSSSVLFMPFMARFRDIYLTSYLIGEGLSGFLPSLLALTQGVGGNPECVATSSINSTEDLVPFYPPARFSITLFFVAMSVLMLSSALGFIGLDRSAIAKHQKINRLPDVNSATPLHNFQIDNSISNQIDSEDSDSNDSNALHSVHSIHSIHSARGVHGGGLSKKVFYSLLLFQCWICALSNGALPSIQSFSCLPYGNTAFHLAVTLSSMANPLACIIAHYVPVDNIVIIGVVNVFGTIISGYILALAALSPTPPLLDHGGGVIMVAAWVLSVGILTYVKVTIASILRREEGNGRRNLFLFGVFTQIGSTAGSVFMFVMVNVYNLFTPYYPCS